MNFDSEHTFSAKIKNEPPVPERREALTSQRAPSDRAEPSTASVNELPLKGDPAGIWRRYGVMFEKPR